MLQRFLPCKLSCLRPAPSESVAGPIYNRTEGICAEKNNQIGIYFQQSIESCKKLCDKDERCFGFEYGVVHRGESGAAGAVAYSPNDCQLSSAVQTAACGGDNRKLDPDFFTKTKGQSRQNLEFSRRLRCHDS